MREGDGEKAQITLRRLALLQCGTFRSETTHNKCTREYRLLVSKTVGPPSKGNACACARPHRRVLAHPPERQVIVDHPKPGDLPRKGGAIEPPWPYGA